MFPEAWLVYCRLIKKGLAASSEAASSDYLVLCSIKTQIRLERAAKVKKPGWLTGMDHRMGVLANIILGPRFWCLRKLLSPFTQNCCGCQRFGALTCTKGHFEFELHKLHIITDFTFRRLWWFQTVAHFSTVSSDVNLSFFCWGWIFIWFIIIIIVSLTFVLHQRWISN